ncbi:MAG: transporter [Clostridia bacterium]
MSKTAGKVRSREEDISFLETYNIETGERKVIKRYDYLIEAPNWTGDGKYLIYNSLGKIYKYDLETGEDIEIPSDYVTHCNNDHVLSPDGSKIAISHGAKEDGKSRIYIMPIEGGIPQLITAVGPSYLHGWSIDGKTLAYAASRDGIWNIHTIPVTGGVEKPITDGDWLDDGCEYDPNGKYIWFNSVRTGLMQAWRMNTDGTDPTQMTFDENWNTWFPHISPDSEKVVMICYKKGDLLPHEHVAHKNVEIRLMTSQGEEVKTLVELFGGQGSINVNSWSPCSKCFAFVSYQLPD